MKKLGLVFLLVTSFVLSVKAQEQKAAVTFDPQYIIEGSTGNRITYDPSQTALANETDIKCVMYFFEDGRWIAYDQPVQQVEGKWVGTFTAPKAASMMFCKFVAGDAVKDPQSVKTDWGWPATYASFVLDKKQQNKQGARIAWALGRMAYSPLSIPGMCEDSTAAPIKPEVGLMWFNNEFVQFPESQMKYFKELYWILSQAKPGEKNDQLKQNVAYYLNDKKLKLTDQQLTNIYDICKRNLGDTVLAQQVRDKDEALYKHTILDRDDDIQRIQQLFAGDWKQGMVEFADMMKTYPTAQYKDASSWITDLFYAKLFRSPVYTPIMKENDYSYVEKYIHDVPYMELISTHWHIVEIPVSNNQIQPDNAYRQSTIIIGEIMNRSREDACRMDLSPREFEDFRLTTFSMALFAHARLCTSLGKYGEAMKYAEMVYPQYKATNTEFATMWITLLQKSGRDSEVVPYIRQCVFNGQTNQEMLDILKADYLKQNPNGDFNKYLSSLQNKSEQDAERQKLIASLINEPINLNHILKDINGKTVDLSKQTGKIMFLDFWATWCAPCKASLPGGQMAVDYYKDDPNVAFYFIDTQETNKGFQKKVADYIKSKGYTFNVLYDNGEAGHQEEVYKDYCKQLQTSGIPFKLIIDAKGRLRWSMCGFNGSPSGMAEEIEMVINYLKTEK